MINTSKICQMWKSVRVRPLISEWNRKVIGSVALVRDKLLRPVGVEKFGISSKACNREYEDVPLIKLGDVQPNWLQLRLGKAGPSLLASNTLTPSFLALRTMNLSLVISLS